VGWDAAFDERADHDTPEAILSASQWAALYEKANPSRCGWKPCAVGKSPQRPLVDLPRFSDPIFPADAPQSKHWRGLRPQIVILVVVGSSPISHPIKS
jgi:hypothetical protein